MKEDVAQSLLATGNDFQDKVWPIIEPWVGGGTVHRVESAVHGSTERILDIYTGTDALIITPDSLLRGIAVRLQVGTAWNSFTVRLGRTTHIASELAKRKAALFDPTQGYWSPHWTVQAYLSAWGGDVLSVALAQTRDLIRLVDKGREGVHYTIRETCDGTRFAAVSWERYAEYTDAILGAPGGIRIWRRE